MIRIFFTFLSSLFCLGILVPGTAQAQTPEAVAKAFAGNWITYDRHFAEQKSCELTFSAQKSGDLYPITKKGCSGDLADIAGWRIQNNQLVFMSSANTAIALVGGNQERLSGTILQNKLPIIIERLEVAQKIEKARKSIQCSYIGYSQTCASPRDFAPPAASIGSPSPVQILVNLNARTEPRNNATIKTVLKPNACVSAEVCTVASDGLWCKVKIENGDAWIKKQTVRQQRWPVITFKNGCS
nr:AprI/Inh family metalloprotease inhibitor [uncultured Cohaesibacter sp.]